jgi:hypothetical protein
MKRSKRERCREAAEYAKEIRKSDRERAKKDKRRADRAIKKALARLRGPNVKRLRDLLAGDLNLSGLGSEYHSSIIPVVAHSPKKQRERFKILMNEVLLKAPRIAEEDFWPAYHILAGIAWLRPVEEWKPKGKSTTTILCSLIDHLVVEYRVPDFLYSVFAVNAIKSSNGRALAHFFRYVAQGGSPYNYLRSAFLPIVMTRRMCHEFMHSPKDLDFFQAVRRAQAVVLGGNNGLVNAICKSRLARGFTYNERFWVSVIKWFCETPALDTDQIGAVIDFISARRRADAGFSMKGRTARSIVRAMEAWHRELARTRKVVKMVFTQSGIPEGRWKFQGKTREGVTVPIIWEIKEILTSEELADEGGRMCHCVYSYANSVKEGLVSIWSLRCQGERLLTVEVRNQSREIVQARGKHNRRATPTELNRLKRWATETGLKLRVR